MLKVSHSIENFNTGHTEIKQTEPYVIFTVDNEEFGVEALKVLELVNYMVPLEMPHKFANVKGMASYRGKIIPIVDLRKIFGLEPIRYDDTTVTIVAESGSVFGITAERVLDLNFIPLTSIKKVSALNFGEKTKYLKSVANFGERLVLLLDLDKMIETESSKLPIAEEPNRFESPTPVEADDGYHEIKLDTPNILESIVATDRAADLIIEEFKDGTVETVPELIIETGPPEADSPILSDTSQAVQGRQADYLIDPKELEDLLNGIPQPEQEGSSSAVNELEATKGELPEDTENQDDNRNMAEVEDNGGLEIQPSQINHSGSQSAIASSVPTDSSSANPEEGIFELEQIAEILSGLESDLARELPDDPFQLQTTAEISVNTNRKEECLSDEEIEAVLKDLQDQSGLNPEEPSSDRTFPDLKDEQNKASEERTDV